MKIKDYKQFPKIECIYGLTFDKKKFYIGSTLNLNDRMRRHLYYLNTNSHHSCKLQRAYNKNNDLNVVILDFNDCHDDLSDLEISYIKEYNSVINGYNMVEDSRKCYAFKQSKQALNNFKKARSKSVIQLDLNGKFIAKYQSISDAANAIGDQSTNISKCCVLNQKSSSKRRGYVFIYESDYDENKEYKYSRYKPTKDHLDKIKNKARNNKRCRKIVRMKDGTEFLSISEFERTNNLYDGYLKYYFHNLKSFTLNGEKYKIL